MVEKWGFNRAIVWVDDEKMTFRVGGELVVEAQVTKEDTGSGAPGVKKLHCTWHRTEAGDWNTWAWAQNSDELRELKAKAAETLLRSGGQKGKGKSIGSSQRGRQGCR